MSANKLISGLVQTDEYFNFILDDGESYEMLHYLMGEKSGYMRMTPTGEELSFNPFLIPFVDPKNDSEKLLVPELEMLTSLSSDNYQSGKSNPAFLLHSTGHWPAHSEIDASIIYADYYYIEALLRLKRLQEGEGVLG